MNTRQLLSAFARDPCLSRMGDVGVYPVDSVRVLSGGSRAYIFNTDPSWKGGEHWVAVFVGAPSGAVEYFDSYGRPPPPQLKLGGSYVWNRRRLQGPLEIICGLYCLYFLRHRCEGWSTRRILDSLPNDGYHRTFLLDWFLRTYSRRR